MVTIREVHGQKLFKVFLDLPYVLHEKDSYWLPPIYSDDKGFFNKAANKLFRNTESLLLLAYKNGKPVGRVMGIIPTSYNERHKLKDVRFNYLESIEDYEVTEALLNYASEWGKKWGCTQLVGPLGFSDKEPQGIEIERNDDTPLIITYVNFPYITAFLEKYGFKGYKDLVSFGIPVPTEYPTEYYEKYKTYLPKHSGLKILAPKTRWTVWKYLRPAVNLINELFVEIYAHNPLSKKDMNALVWRFVLLLLPKHMKGVLNEKGELVAFVIGMPDFSKGIQESRGKLFPFGFLKVFKAMKRSKELVLMIGGIKKEYRNIGLDYWLSIEIFNTIIKDGIHTVKSHLILDENRKTHAKMLKFGGFINKRFRIYKKDIF
ncbi:hypothetical protein [Jiulongibacter sediminis]|jgi:hypothetical protein|uniref:hypothetical protein n=1 Tax=Jiulongibacter sediminis TaxID=1605367 RepID=UPI0026EC012F|nr:hypothetical protein [Jiulongibacter sediminis]